MIDGINRPFTIIFYRYKNTDQFLYSTPSIKTMNINYVILLLAVIVYSAYCREWYVEPESALLNPGNANVKLCGRKKSSACSAKILSTIQGNLLPGDSLIFTGVRPANGGSPYVGTTYQMPDVVLTGLKGNTTIPSILEWRKVISQVFDWLKVNTCRSTICSLRMSSKVPSLLSSAETRILSWVTLQSKVLENHSKF